MDFTGLEVWQKAHQLVLKIYQVTKEFPSEEKYRLTDQLCRSASSIPANIAEGTGRNTTKEYIQFLYTARGSVEETKYHLLLARDLGYVDDKESRELWKKAKAIGRMLNGLISSLKKSKTP